jgi:hypothetical protein
MVRSATGAKALVIGRFYGPAKVVPDHDTKPERTTGTRKTCGKWGGGFDFAPVKPFFYATDV